LQIFLASFGQASHAKVVESPSSDQE
jgi:hypothetical protein